MLICVFDVVLACFLCLLRLLFFGVVLFCVCGPCVCFACFVGLGCFAILVTVFLLLFVFVSFCYLFFLFDSMFCLCSFLF